MALLWADGFEHYDVSAAGRTNMLQGAWAEVTYNNATRACFPVTGISRTGNASLSIYTENASDMIIRRVLGTIATKVGVGYGIYLKRLPTINTVHRLHFRSNTNADIITMVIQSDGSIAVRSGGVSGTIIGISDAIITVASWNHIEISTTIDSIVGEVEVRVNGVTVIKLTNQNLGSANAAAAAWATRGNSNNNEDGCYIDDIFAWDETGGFNNDFIGPARVLTLFPNADTAQADFAVTGAASGYAAINEVAPNGDTSYIAGGTKLDKSDFGLPTLPSEVLGINGVYVPVMARSDDAGVSTIKMSMVSGADLAAGPEIPLTTAYSYWGSIFEVNPTTGLKWTKAALEAALIRAEKVD